MSILFGILLYVLCIAFLCALAGANRVDDSEPQAHGERELSLSTATAPAGHVTAPEARG